VLATVIVAIALSVGVFVGAGLASSGAPPKIRLCVAAGGAARVLLSAHKSCGKGEPLVYVQAWLPNALSGARGPAGARGAQGQSGAAGANGAQGPAGSAGPSGAQGSTGASGAQGIQGTSGPTGPSGPGDTTVSLASLQNGILPGSTITIGTLVLTPLCSQDDNQVEFSTTTGSLNVTWSSVENYDGGTAAPLVPQVLGIGPQPSVLLTVVSNNTLSSTESTTFYAVSPSGKIITGHITLWVSTATGCTSTGYATTLN